MSKNIGFIGLGNMGYFMAKNLIKNRFNVYGYDVNEETLEKAYKDGVQKSKSISDVCMGKDLIITMLPDGKSVRSVWLEVLKFIEPNTSIIDCSTIDVKTTVELHQLFNTKNILNLDAPVSGGTIGAENGTLTFIVGGRKEAYEKLSFIFDFMGKEAIYCGEGGSGQSTKMCNNLLLAITMKGLGDVFKLADKLNIEKEKLYDVISISTGSCWAINNYFPAKDVGPNSPADNDFKPGFAALLMHKDLSLAMSAANDKNLDLDLGEIVYKKYAKMLESGKGNLDFSAIVNE